MIFTWNAFSVGANTVIDWLGEFNRAKVVTSLQSRNKDLEIFLDSQLKDEILNYRAKSDCLYNSLSQVTWNRFRYQYLFNKLGTILMFFLQKLPTRNIFEFTVLRRIFWYQYWHILKKNIFDCTCTSDLIFTKT